MNSRTAKQINRAAAKEAGLVCTMLGSREKYPVVLSMLKRDMKAKWYGTPRPERNRLRKSLIRRGGR